MQVASREDDRGQRCPLCHASLASDGVVSACEACGTAAHAGCLRDLAEARCPTLGCARALRSVVPEKSEVAGWVSRRVAVVVGVAVLLVVLLGANEWRAHAAFVELSQRYGSSGWSERDPAEWRAFAAELRAAPRGLLDDRSGPRLERMVEAAEQMARALEQVREREELRERMVREVQERQHPK